MNLIRKERSSSGQELPWIIPVVLLLLFVSVTAVTTLQFPLCQYVCKCDTDMTFIDCTGSNLTAVPKAIPHNVQRLILSKNKIRHIKSSDFSGLHQVEKLMLERNEIMFIEQGAFKNLYKLKILFLSHNLLVSVPSGVFQHLPSLEKLELQNNLIKTIKKDAFLFLPQLKEIRLEENPIFCNCELKGFIRYMKRPNKAHVIVVGHCTDQESVIELSVIPLEKFPECKDEDTFEKNLRCHTCADEKCHKQRVDTCQGVEPVCMNRISMKGSTLKSEKLCSTYNRCVDAEASNVARCNEWSNGTMCVSCCTWERCNKNDFAGWTHTFRLTLSFTMDKDFSAELLEKRSDEYRELAKDMQKMLENDFLNQNGTFSVSILHFTLPKVTVISNISCTVPVLVDELQVWHRINKILLNSKNLDELDINRTTLKLTGRMLCNEEMTKSEKGEFKWQTAKVGTMVELPCYANDKKATRKCIVNEKQQNQNREFAQFQMAKRDTPRHAVWGEPNTTSCFAVNWITRELQDLVLYNIDEKNIELQSSRLLNISKNAVYFKEIDVILSVNILAKMMPLVKNISTRLTLDNVIPIINNMIDSPEKILIQAEQSESSANRMLGMIESISEQIQFEKQQVSQLYSNLGIGAIKVDRNNFNGVTFATKSQHLDNTTRKSMKLQPSASALDKNTSSFISLPKSIFKKVKLSVILNVSRITFLWFHDDKLYKAVEKTGSKVNSTNRVVQRVNSQVISATVPGLKLLDLAEPILLSFGHISKVAKNPVCVYWDESSQNISHWSSKGCSVQYDIVGKSTSCACNHLTSFALLMDIYDNESEVKNAKALSIISNIGCGISFISLLITIMIYVCFKTIRKAVVSQILISLCTALAIANFIFLVGMQPYAMNKIVSCKAVAALLHYFLLVAMMWMAVEGVHIYMAMVIVFRTYLHRFLAKSSLFAWGLPVIIIALTLGINKTDNYAKKGEICWLTRPAFYGAFLAPVTCVIIFNISIFSIVFWRLRSMQKVNKFEHKSKKLRLVGIVGVFILLGLTWALAFLAFGKATTVFKYLFTIFNTLQGLFIFLFYCIYKKETREIITKYLCTQKREKYMKNEKCDTNNQAAIKNTDLRTRITYSSDSGNCTNSHNGTESTNVGNSDENSTSTNL